jgi:hypothetical protein
MNETVILVLAGSAGVLLGVIFLRRPLVDGAQGAFRPNGRRFGSSAACCCE